MSRIDDIRVNENIDDVFNTYERPEIIGKRIFDSFIKLYKENKGFQIDENGSERYGIISNIMALSTLLDLNISMNVDISSFEDGFKFLLSSIFDNIYQNPAKIIFDASPYMINSDSKDERIESYIETASKICVIMIDLREYAIKNDQLNNSFGKPIVLAGRKVNDFGKLKEEAEHLMIDAIKILTDSCLYTKSDVIEDYKINGKIINRTGLDTKIKYRGWTFQKPQPDENDEYSTSIYFTYHATNAFISLYNAYYFLFEKEFANVEYNVEDMGVEEREKHDLDVEFFYANIELFAKFREMTASSGRYIDSIIKKNGIDLSFDYIKSGFKSIASSRILESQKNNYVIDTLFVLAILINAGIDEDYSVADQREYFYNMIQYALTNIKKIYSILKQSKHEDSIDSYQLNFTLLNDKFPDKYNTMVQRFRSTIAGIAVYDLVPLLCNTYAIISDYLIQYPQREMIDNLELIMDNRALDEWYWDKKGFNINNNLYYIFALENFYEYYNKYELPLSNKGKEYNKIAYDVNQQLIKKTEELKSLQTKLKEARTALADKQSALDEEVYKIAEKMYKSNIDLSIEAFFKSMIDDCCLFALEVAEKGSSAIKTGLEVHKKAAILLKMTGCVNMPKLFVENDIHLLDLEMQERTIEKSLLNEINNIVRQSLKSVGDFND